MDALRAFRASPKRPRCRGKDGPKPSYNGGGLRAVLEIPQKAKVGVSCVFPVSRAYVAVGELQEILGGLICEGVLRCGRRYGGCGLRRANGWRRVQRDGAQKRGRQDVETKAC
ncbi:MAG: hypothetical protein EBS01_09005 [Verrucomicrobia bacterium]|nr:hypothetical protein [Verrucomicrobiota bacterium]